MLISAEHEISNPYLINLMQFAEVLFFPVLALRLSLF